MTSEAGVKASVSCCATTNLCVTALHDQHSVPDGTELLEDLGEILGHLLERQLNTFVLAMIQMIDQVFDGLKISKIKSHTSFYEKQQTIRGVNT